MTPAVGLYVPVRDGARTLAATLAGIAALDPAPARVLVVDDGSRDGSAALARRAGVEVVRVAPRGLAAARNVGWRTLGTPWVAALDADCRPAPDWLGRLTAALEAARADVAGVGGRLIEDGPRVADRWRARWLPQDWGPSAREVPFLFGANGLLRRDALLAADGYDERHVRNAEDHALGHRLVGLGWRLRHVPEARVRHLCRDRRAGVLRRYCHHRFYGHRLPIGWPGLLRSLLVHLRSSASMVRQDLLAGRHELLGLDLALAPLAVWHDLQATVGHRRGRP